MHIYIYIPPWTLYERFKADVETAVNFDVCATFLEEWDNMIQRQKIRCLELNLSSTYSPII